MASKTLLALSVLALTRNAYSLRFSGPQPTSIEQDEPGKDLQGWTPKPTDSPIPGRWGIELVKRVTSSVGPRTCGWVYNPASSSSSVLTCALGTCMLYTSGTAGMAGCCYGTSSYATCGWVNQCYDYADYMANKCGSSCMANDLIRVCTASSKPYCQSWTYPGKNIKDYGCGTESVSTYTSVYSAITADYTASVDLLYAPQNALEGISSTRLSGTLTRYTSGSTTRRIGTATSLRSGGDSYTSSTTGSTTVLLAPLIAILVIILVCWLAAAGLIIYCCRRSKKLTAKWDQPSGFNNRSVAPIGAAAAMASTPQFGQQQPQSAAASGYFNGAPNQGYYADTSKAGNVQNQQAYPSAQGSPAVDPASPAPPYPGQPQFQNTSPGTYPAQPHMQGQPQMAAFPGQPTYAYPQQQGTQVYELPQQQGPHHQPPPQQQQSVFEMH